MVMINGMQARRVNNPRKMNTAQKNSAKIVKPREMVLRYEMDLKILRTGLQS